MRKGKIFFAFFLLFGKLISQAPKSFYQKYGGDGVDIGYGVRETFGQKYVIVGSTTSFGNDNNTDAILILVDNMGQVLWQKTFGGNGIEVGKKIIRNPIDSGFVFAGYTSSNSNTGYDVFVVRTDKNGSIIWTKNIGGNDWEFGEDLTLADDGNIIVCGSSYGAGRGKMDAYVLKVAMSSGQMIWEKKYGGAEDDQFRSIIHKPGTDYYITGTTKSFGDLNGDILFYRLNNNGDSLMRIVYGGPLMDAANSIALNDTNEIFLAGSSESFSNGKADAFFVKFDKNGNFVWRKNYGIAGEDESCLGIVHSATRGYSENTAIFTTLEKVQTKKDIKTIFLESDGSYFGGVNSGSFGFEEDEEAFSLDTTSDKGYVQVGYTNSFGANSSDIFLVKQDSLLDEGAGFTNVGIHQFKQAPEGFSIYPNPIKINGCLTIAANVFSKNYALKIIDQLGQNVFENKDIDSNVYSIWPDFSKGFYTLIIYDELNSYSIKLSIVE